VIGEVSLVKMARSCKGEREECKHGIDLHVGGESAKWLRIFLSNTT
jgi:hypothetical protein